MSRVKETHLWFENGDDEIQVESYWKDLNEAIFDLQKTVPDDVVIIDNEETGFLRAAVKLTRLTFRTIKPQSEKNQKGFFRKRQAKQ